MFDSGVSLTEVSSVRSILRFVEAPEWPKLNIIRRIQSSVSLLIGLVAGPHSGERRLGPTSGHFGS